MEPTNLHIGILLSEDIVQYLGYKIYDAQGFNLQTAKFNRTVCLGITRVITSRLSKLLRNIVSAIGIG